MTFKQAHSSNYTVGRNRPIDRIVLHFTAGNGDTAANNSDFFAKANRGASAHYFVDENTVVQSVKEGDTAWHAGNWEMNNRSIGIEMCSRKDSRGNYYIPDATVKRAAELTRELMLKYGIPVTGVIRHYDVTGKKCPAPMVDNAILWNNFKAMLTVEEKPQGKIPADTPSDWAKEAWQAAYDKVVMDGTRPADPITRQEMAVILSRLGHL